MHGMKKRSVKLLRANAIKSGRDRGSAHKRALTVSLISAVIFAVIIGKLVSFGLTFQPHQQFAIARILSSSLARPDIVDRDGRLLATDISMPSLFADPQRIIDADEVAEKLVLVFADLDPARLRAKLSRKKRRFVWIKRGISPGIAQKIHNLGLPGLGFRSELRRIYPAGQLAGHILGYVNVDNRGMAGIERYIDEDVGVAVVQGPGQRDFEPVRLTIDLKVQYALREELKDAQTRYGAKAVAGVVIDSNKGDVLAMSSLPDFDPNRPLGSLKKNTFDRMTQGVYELGSVFKALTVGMVLDSGVGDLTSTYDARQKIRTGAYEIRDFHGRKRVLSMKEVFLYSSNIGAARMATDLGRSRMIRGLRRFGLTTPLKTEIGRSAKPKLPAHWGEVEVMTAGFGHGLAVTPLQFAASVMPLVNGGFYILPRFVFNGEIAKTDRGKRVLRRKTSDILRKLLRENVSGPSGTGRRADVEGYRVGGKTGTAEMPVAVVIIKTG